jgi:hypothetical protein
MTGTLNMNGSQLANRGCPGGYLRVGPGLCVENVDQGANTFIQCANRCRGQGTHMCTAAEFRAVALNVSPVGGLIEDWVDDLDSPTNAFRINDQNGAVVSEAITVPHFCRCCANVE